MGESRIIEIPRAHDVAAAIVASARQTSEHPESCARGAVALHCRRYAYKILAEQFPHAKKIMLAKLVGASSYESYPYAQTEPWFRLATMEAAKREYLRLGGAMRGVVLNEAAE